VCSGYSTVLAVTALHATRATPSVSFYLSPDSAILHYPATNKKKRREYYFSRGIDKHVVLVRAIPFVDVADPRLLAWRAILVHYMLRWEWE
jgi:hypothetical protein